MKVGELVKKINGCTVKQPVYLQQIYDSGTRREAVSFDFAGYYSDEEDRTVVQVELRKDGMYIYYK